MKEKRMPFLQLSTILLNGHFKIQENISVLRGIDQTEAFKCPLCSKKLPQAGHERAGHLSECIYKTKKQGGQPGDPAPTGYTRSERSIMKGQGVLITYKSTEIHDNFLLEFSKLKNSFLQDFEKYFKRFKHVKAALECPILFQSKQAVYEGVFEDKLRHINTPLRQLHSVSDLDDLFEFWQARISQRIAEHTDGESGMRLISCVQFNLRIYECNPLAIGCGTLLTPKLKAKLGRNYKSKLINPYTPHDQFCILWAISIFCTERDKIDCNKENLKTHLENLASKENIWCTDYLKTHYNEWFQTLYERCAKKNISFPVALSKTHLSKLVNALQLDLQMNFLGFDEDTSEFFNIFCSSKIALFETILNQDNDMSTNVLKIENVCLDLLFTNQTEDQVHSVLITSIRKVLSHLSKCKDPILICRICYYRTYKKNLYVAHIKQCDLNNREYTMLKLMEPEINDEGVAVAPTIKGQPRLAREFPLFQSYMDYEVGFFQMTMIILKSMRFSRC